MGIIIEYNYNSTHPIYFIPTVSQLINDTYNGTFINRVPYHEGNEYKEIYFIIDEIYNDLNNKINNNTINNNYRKIFSNARIDALNFYEEDILSQYGYNYITYSEQEPEHDFIKFYIELQF